MTTPTRSAVDNLRFLFEQTHGYLEGTMAGISQDAARYEPGGPASILGQYAHLVTSEDWFINVKLTFWVCYRLQIVATNLIIYFEF